MSSHSNKRQSHHLQQYNPTIVGDTSQQNSSTSHNFFSRRTVSNKDQPAANNNGTQSFKHASSNNNGAHLQLQQQYSGGSTGVTAEPQQFSTTTYPFSPVGGASSSSYPRGAAAMVVDGSHMQAGDPRMKFAVSVNGVRSSHEGSPSKQTGYAGTQPQTTHSSMPNTQALPSGDTTVANVAETAAG